MLDQHLAVRYKKWEGYFGRKPDTMHRLLIATNDHHKPVDHVRVVGAPAAVALK